MNISMNGSMQAAPIRTNSSNNNSNINNHIIEGNPQVKSSPGSFIQPPQQQQPCIEDAVTVFHSPHPLTGNFDSPKNKKLQQLVNAAAIITTITTTTTASTRNTALVKPYAGQQGTTTKEYGNLSLNVSTGIAQKGTHLAQERLQYSQLSFAQKQYNQPSSTSSAGSQLQAQAIIQTTTPQQLSLQQQQQVITQKDAFEAFQLTQNRPGMIMYPQSGYAGVQPVKPAVPTSSVHGKTLKPLFSRNFNSQQSSSQQQQQSYSASAGNSAKKQPTSNNSAKGITPFQSSQGQQSNQQAVAVAPTVMSLPQSQLSMHSPNRVKSNRYINFSEIPLFEQSPQSAHQSFALDHLLHHQYNTHHHHHHHSSFSESKCKTEQSAAFPGSSNFRKQKKQQQQLQQQFLSPQQLNLQQQQQQIEQYPLRVVDREAQADAGIPAVHVKDFFSGSVVHRSVDQRLNLIAASSNHNNTVIRVNPSQASHSSQLYTDPSGINSSSGIAVPNKQQLVTEGQSRVRISFDSSQSAAMKRQLSLNNEEQSQQNSFSGVIPSNMATISQLSTAATSCNGSVAQANHMINNNNNVRNTRKRVVSATQQLKQQEEMFYRRASPMKYIKSITNNNKVQLRAISIDPEQQYFVDLQSSMTATGVQPSLFEDTTITTTTTTTTTTSSTTTNSVNNSSLHTTASASNNNNSINTSSANNSSCNARSLKKRFMILRGEAGSSNIEEQYGDSHFRSTATTATPFGAQGGGQQQQLSQLQSEQQSSLHATGQQDSIERSQLLMNGGEQSIGIVNERRSSSSPTIPDQIEASYSEPAMLFKTNSLSGSKNANYTPQRMLLTGPMINGISYANYANSNSTFRMGSLRARSKSKATTSALQHSQQSYLVTSSATGGTSFIGMSQSFAQNGVGAMTFAGSTPVSQFLAGQFPVSSWQHKREEKITQILSKCTDKTYSDPIGDKLREEHEQQLKQANACLQLEKKLNQLNGIAAIATTTIGSNSIYTASTTITPNSYSASSQNPHHNQHQSPPHFQNNITKQLSQQQHRLQQVKQNNQNISSSKGGGATATSSALSQSQAKNSKNNHSDKIKGQEDPSVISNTINLAGTATATDNGSDDNDDEEEEDGDLDFDDEEEDDDEDDVDDDEGADEDEQAEDLLMLQQADCTAAASISPNYRPGLLAIGQYAKLLLLKSVYENRPATVFFPYPHQCGVEFVRDASRTHGVSEYEEKRYDMRFKVTTNSLNLCVIHAFQYAGVRETEESDWNICWGTGRENRVRSMVRFQKTNHFPQCWNMGRKDSLWKNLSRVKRKFPAEYDFIPNTYILQHQVDWERFLSKRDDAERGKLWIMKPSNQAQGKNIKMISKKSRVQRKQEYIICEYVANPHLIDGLKYDLRIYVLVTSYDPLRVYIFDDGLTRFATEKYSTNAKELSKRYVHLTNYSLNKNNPKFKQNIDAAEDSVGSKWSLQALFRKYREIGVDVDVLWGKIKDIIVKTCIAAEPYMLDTYAKCENHRTNCFELYGFDVLIDDTLKPWLLEVNVRPALSSSSPLDRKIKHSLICDTFNLIGLQPFDKRKFDEDLKRRIPGAAKRSNVQSKFLKDLCDLDETNCFEKLSPEDFNMLFETDEENYRTGHFERIFPLKEKFDYYSQFFEYERYNNLIVKGWLNAKHNFLEKILQKNSTLNV